MGKPECSRLPRLAALVMGVQRAELRVEHQSQPCGPAQIRHASVVTQAALTTTPPGMASAVGDLLQTMYANQHLVYIQTR